MLRLFILTLFWCFTFTSSQANKVCHPQKGAEHSEATIEKVVGEADAPLVIVSYTSFTCTHCAEFHQKTLPALEKEYVATGKVRLILRDFPLDRAALKAAKLAWCKGPEHYATVAREFFATQQKWLSAKTPEKELEQIALKTGISKDEMHKCLIDKNLEDKILHTCVGGIKTFKIDSTPTLLVGEEAVRYAADMEELRPIIEAQLKQALASNQKKTSWLGTFFRDFTPGLKKMANQPTKEEQADPEDKKQNSKAE